MLKRLEIYDMVVIIDRFTITIQLNLLVNPGPGDAEYPGMNGLEYKAYAYCCTYNNFTCPHNGYPYTPSIIKRSFTSVTVLYVSNNV